MEKAMKKSVVATIGGVILGIVLMLSVFSILNMKPVNEDVLAQNEEVVKKEETLDFGRLNIEEKLNMEVVIEELETEEETEKDVQSTPVTTTTQLPYYIKVNRQANCVTVYTADENGNYTIPIKAMTCSVGLNNGTPLGVSKISDKYEWRLLFGNVYGHYSVRFNGHILFHSVPYMTKSNDTLKEGQFNLLGQPASQGCIRLCVADAKWIYDNCAKGTIVEVYDSPEPGPLGKPSMPQISQNSPFRGWDPTDPNGANPWHSGSVTIHGAQNLSVEAGTTIDLLQGVSATDVDGLNIEVITEGNVDFNTPGRYGLTYKTTGVLGQTVTVGVIVTVLSTEAGELEDVADTETEVSDTSNTEELIPPSTQEQEPLSTQEQVPPSIQEQGPASTQEQETSSTQEQGPPSTQEQVPTSTENTVPETSVTETQTLNIEESNTENIDSEIVN